MRRPVQAQSAIGRFRYSIEGDVQDPERELFQSGWRSRPVSWP